jgi:hypothetical protein
VKDRTRKIPDTSDARFGVPIESALARRDRLANRYDYIFGQERVFPELVVALLEEIPEGTNLLEVGAAAGLLTRPLLTKAGTLTALEPSAGMLMRLLESDVANDDRLATMQGMVEDLTDRALFDDAVVTFTPRRGMGLLTLLTHLATHVSNSIVMLLDDDGSMDWAYVARAAAIQGFDVRVRVVTNNVCGEHEQKRAILLTAGVALWCEECSPEELWELEARVVDVPFPAPRGAATRLMRYFLNGGDRAIVVKTETEGIERLYGNLRTAAHRLGRDEVTVRRVDDGIQLVRLPKAVE